jgi:hypothetical protein
LIEDVPMSSPRKASPDAPTDMASPDARDFEPQYTKAPALSPGLLFIAEGISPLVKS